MSELILMENPRRRRRRRRNPSNPRPAAIATPVLLLGLAYAGWVLYNRSKHGTWNWQPWKTMPIGRRLIRANPLRQNPNSGFDQAVADMMRPAASVIENTKWTPPRTKRGDEETIGFINP